ncbi:Ppx/GppA phosphatase family protein [uncultured Acetobacterium sp.]|uniref:Ppx/GppA phosphatase family protein n=1 Tax=uncultured Acetobacterium sp. TaxID=217139 RepID=UPI0025D2D2A6|nr:Ppx/GppA phosphatase family protein [uncultured Acetobacterium sp.]
MERRNIGVIDIGSNSVHLVIGEYYNNEYFQIIDDVKVNVRLNDRLAETGKLQQERMDFGIQTLSMFVSMCDAYGIQKVIAVATAAIRKASNGAAYVARIKTEVGLDVTIITGEVEAAMDYLGAINTLDIKDALLMDIGGGSTEFVLIKDRKKVDAISLPFGSIDLAEKFDLMDEVTDKKLKTLDHFLKDAFGEMPLLEKASGLPVIGVGGTIRNVGRIHRSFIDYPLEIAHNYRMKSNDVKRICEMAASMNLAERSNLKGLSKGRIDIFVGSSHALERVMKHIGSPELIISNAGLRDGIIYDYFGYNEENLVYDIFELSLVNIMLNFNVNIPHAYHVLKLTENLFEQLKPLHGINWDVRKMIRASAMLHDVGIKLQFGNHHEHSFYIILNSGLLGIEQKELLMSAFIALNHRTNKKIQISEEYFGLLQDDERHLIDQLSLFLQISEYLDRSMDGVVKDVNCVIMEKEVQLNVLTTGHSVFDDLIISECGKKFKRVFNKTLTINNKVIISKR